MSLTADPLTVMSLIAECNLLFGWAADPRYIFELCFIFLSHFEHMPKTDLLVDVTEGRTYLLKHDGQRGFSMQKGGTAIVLDQAACIHKYQQ